VVLAISWRLLLLSFFPNSLLEPMQNCLSWSIVTLFVFQCRTVLEEVEVLCGERRSCIEQCMKSALEFALSSCFRHVQDFDANLAVNRYSEPNAIQTSLSKS
jgi:hypothetical protein